MHLSGDALREVGHTLTVCAMVSGVGKHVAEVVTGVQ
jgi:hypothetical protein